MSKTIYLYLKTHNKTGLKYIGQTTRDPFKYNGSGKYWKRHLKKHGNDVSTEILLKTNDEKELKEAGLYYSDLWDIVNSENFANLTTEEGQGGNNANNIDYDKLGKKLKKLFNSEEYKKNVDPIRNEKHRQTILSEEWKSTVGKERVAKMKLTKESEEWKSSIGLELSKKLKKLYNDPAWRKKHEETCEFCGKTTNPQNYARWHGNKCKLNKV